MPSLANRTHTRAFEDTDEPRLGERLRLWRRRTLQRVTSMRTIYIWYDDLTSTLLFNELRAAAARGVRVQLRLDDNHQPGFPRSLLRWNRTRISRSDCLILSRSDGQALSFPRLSKSFTIDNQATIVGGRDIGDDYSEWARLPCSSMST